MVYAQQTRRPAGRAVTGARRRVAVLVIDDELETRDMLAAILEHAGYSAATAGDGRDALVLLRSIRPALILLDIQMPVMDGFEFRQAQRHDPDLLQIPTVVMTGSKEEPVLDVAVTAVLHKPFRANQLLSIVGRVCDPQRSR